MDLCKVNCWVPSKMVALTHLVNVQGDIYIYYIYIIIYVYIYIYIYYLYIYIYMYIHPPVQVLDGELLRSRWGALEFA